VERDFSPNATQQVNVQVVVPAGATPGNYNFRLDVASVSNPDEDYTEGPAIKIEVKQTVPPRPPFPFWIIPVIVVGLAVIGVVIWLMLPKKVQVPKVIGLTVAEAKAALKDNNLRWEEKQETRSTRTVDPGKVAEQNPEAGQEVKRDSIVELFVEATPPPDEAMVPNLVGLPFDQAQDLLARAYLKAVKKEPPQATLDFTPGVITNQEPPAFKSVKLGETVSLTVAGDSVRVPGTSGLSGLAASQRLGEAGLLVGGKRGDGSKLQYDDNDKVIRTEPIEGTVVLRGSKITFIVPGPRQFRPWIIERTHGGVVARPNR
jgi:beta-lactam-binding protein with PASTA domain